MGFVNPPSAAVLRRKPAAPRCMHRSRVRSLAQRTRACAESPPPAAAPEVPEVPDFSGDLRAPDAVVTAAHAAADAAGAVIRRHFRTGLVGASKGDMSPVTVADTEAEAAIRSVISATFPGHAVLGEERGGDLDALQHAEWAWAIDPIDGTKAFMAGKPTFGILIAVLRRGVPVFGIVDQPVARERWAGGAGRPATLNGASARAAPSGPLAAVAVHATTPDMFAGLDAAAFRAVARRARHVVYGSDCYAYALLAAGHVHAVVEADLKPWDFLALAPVVEAAGGAMSDWYGERIGPACDGRVVAAASHDLLDEILEALESGLQKPKEFGDRGPGHVEAVAGFGSATEADAVHAVTVRIRVERCEVCQVTVRAPDALAEYEAEVAAMVEAEVLRGRVAVSIDVFGVEQGREGSAIVAERKVAAQAKEVLDGIARDMSTDVPVDMSNILHMMNRLSTGRSVGSTDLPTPSLELVRRAVTSAVSKLLSARRQTGAVLEHDALERIAEIETIVEQLEARLADATKEKAATDGRNQPGKVPWGPGVEQVRAHAHMLSVGFMGVDGPVGIKLALLSREILRSARSICGHSNNAVIAHHGLLIEEQALALREIGERIR